jgi:AcrR family transcriptional regulator
MQEQPTDHARSSRTRHRILQATIELYREIGYGKTTVADIAHRAAMSPANVYRFFRSKRQIEEVVVAELLDEVFQAAANAACRSGSLVHRLAAILRTISQQHERRLANDERLHELVAIATDANWPIMLAYVDRIVGLLAPMIATGQARGEIREGSAAMLARCLLAAMNAHVTARETSAAAVQPGFDEMMGFCVNALCLPQSRIAIYRRSVGQN